MTSDAVATSTQFHRTDMCNVALSVPGWLLEEKYGDGAGRVNYKAFQAAIDGSFTPAGLEQHPTASFSGSFVPASTMPSLAGDEEAQVEAILDRIAEYIRTRKVLARPAFVEHEQDQNSVMIIHHVTATQFASTLTRLASRRCSPDPGRGEAGRGVRRRERRLARVLGRVDVRRGPDHESLPSSRQQDAFDGPEPTDAALIAKSRPVPRERLRVHSSEDFDKLRATSRTRSSAPVCPWPWRR